MPGLEDQTLVTLSVEFDGVTRDCGVWDKREGGNFDSEESTYYPGGRGEPESLGGHKTFENVTLSRRWKIDRDPALRPFLMAVRGKARATVVEHDLDDNDQPVSNPHGWQGTLKAYTPPTSDSESSDPRMVQIEVTIDRALG